MKQTRSHLIVLALVVAVLGAVFSTGYYHPIRLGLDLQGGLEIVLQANPNKGQKLTQDDLTKSVEIIRSRVDALGVSEPEIRTQGANQIAVELAGEKNPDRAVGIIGSTAQLKFYSFEDHVVGTRAYRNPYDILKKNETDAVAKTAAAQKKVDAATKALADAKTSKAKKAAAKQLNDAQFDETWYLFDASHKQVGTTATSQADVTRFAKGALVAGKLPAGWETLAVPPGEVLLRGQPDRIPMTVNETGKFDRLKGVYLLLQDKPAITGDAIKSATAESQNGEWVTSILFKGPGGTKFGKVTQQIARRGALEGRQQSFAIVLDDEIKSTPTIDYNKYPNGIQGNSALISGQNSRQEAQDLALVLNTGALPVKFEVISKTTVSATLGSQSLQQGLYAGAAGLLVVMIYLIIFYRFLGLIADVALLIYSFIFYGLIVGIPITMTLPGIAGMILTIAVAADANIIIFERIREEYRAGRSVSASIRGGYSKGLRTIIDANVVTLITAAVLFIIATGTVRGFALLLFLGTLLSMFTAVLVTYSLLGLISDFRIFQKAWVIGGSTKPLRFHFKWMKYRKYMFGFTAFIIVASLSLVFGKGLNLGVDFKSGTKFDVVLAQKVGQEDVRNAIQKVNRSYGAAIIQATQQPTTGGKAAPKNQSSFAIQVERLKTSGTAVGHNSTERANNAQQNAETALTDALDKKFGVKSKSVTTIGPSFGKQVLNGAIVAIIVSLVLEVLYISLRFERKYALPVLIALAHDIIIALGAYALTGREFKSATVAALLTILGYSLYDTIIVYDRIRENVHIMRKSSFARITDASLNEVLTRSLNTTLVVIGPIGALFLFGGDTLKDFAYALLIGIVAGAYSSIIIASPILCWLMEREPAWMRRKEIEEGTVKALPGSAAKSNGGQTVVSSTTGTSTVLDQQKVTAPDDSAAGGPANETPQQRRDRRSRSQRKR